MTRWFPLAGACALALSIGVSAQDASSHGGGPQPSANPSGGSPQMQQLRAALQKDLDEAKRLRAAVKMDKDAGNKAALDRDHVLVTANKEAIKRDRDAIRDQQLVEGRGRQGRQGAGRQGGDGSGRGRGRNGGA